MSTQRRSKPLRPDHRPLTPEPQVPEPLTYSELLNQNAYLNHITAAERRRHATVEKQFVKALTDIQNTLDAVRQLYMAQIALRPGPSEKR